MTNKEAISIIIPTLNESGNIAPLTERIHTTLAKKRIPYEIIFVDDHSTDATIAEIQALQATYPNITIAKKVGEQGKAYSLLQGFKAARHQILCMIDADLQYPPEAIGAMYDKMLAQSADVVVTERIEQKTNWLRQLSTKTFNLIFTRMLFGIDYDSQSGLKLFRRYVIESIHVTPSPWSFDLEFLVRSLEKNYTIATQIIQFSERYAGQAKLHMVSATYELIRASLKLKFNSSGKEIKRGYQASIELSKRPLVFIGALASALLLSLAALPAVNVSAQAPVEEALERATQAASPIIDTKPVTDTLQNSTSNVPSTGSNGVVGNQPNRGATANGGSRQSSASGTTNSSTSSNQSQAAQVNNAGQAAGTSQPATNLNHTTNVALASSPASGIYRPNSFSADQTQNYLNYSRYAVIVGLALLAIVGSTMLGNHFLQSRQPHFYKVPSKES